MLAEGWPGRGSRRRGSTKHRGGGQGQLAGDARGSEDRGLWHPRGSPFSHGADPTGGGAGLLGRVT